MMRWNMSVSARLRTAAVTTFVTVIPVAGAPAAKADPATDPCRLAESFFCQFMPIAPELEGDIDLTQNQPPVDPAVPLPEELRLTDMCALGCL